MMATLMSSYLLAPLFLRHCYEQLIGNFCMLVDDEFYFVCIAFLTLALRFAVSAPVSLDKTCKTWSV
jgi:hypothetical protein